MESASQLNNQQSTVIAGNAYRIHQNSVPEVYSISQLLNIVTYIQTIIINHNQTYKQISKLDLDSNLIGNQLKVITRDCHHFYEVIENHQDYNHFYKVTEN